MQPLIDKICNKCGEAKPLSAFHKNKSCRGGVVGTCRTCTNLRVKNWIDKNSDEYRSRINQRNRDVKREMVAHFGGVCHDCLGVYHQCVFEFHHLDPSEKDVHPSKALTWSRERMMKELEKCVMLCSNCHRVRHYGDS